MSTNGITWNADLYLDICDELNETITETEAIRATNRIAKEMAAEVDLPSLILTSILYYCGEDAEKYLIPSDMKSDALISIQPRVGVNYRPIKMVSPFRFHRYNSGEFITIMKNSAKEYFKILHSEFTGQQVIFTACETSLTADGTWTASGDASNATHDDYTYYKDNGAINFDVSGTSATMTFVKSSVVDISDMTKQMRVRFFMKLPTAPTSVTVRWGNDASNYYSHALTTQVSGEAFSTSGWNELEASKASATQTGTVDDEQIDYFAIILAFGGATTQTDYIIDHITFCKPEELLLEYYSKNIARTAAGVYGEKLTVSASTTDLLNFYDEYRQTIVDGVCWRYLRMHGDKQAKADANAYKLDFINGKQNIKNKYPSRRMVISRVRELPVLAY